MLGEHMQVVSEQSMVADILLMKQANFNAVRMSHYPNTQRFYQLCTAFGLYAVDETNLETHGFDAALCRNYLNPANSQLWTACMLDRAVRMFEHNKNHGWVPSSPQAMHACVPCTLSCSTCVPTQRSLLSRSYVWACDSKSLHQQRGALPRTHKGSLFCMLAVPRIMQ